MTTATTVDDKRIVATQTLLLRDGEVGRFEVPVDDVTLPVRIRFLPGSRDEPTVDWQYFDGTLSVDCVGWGNNLPDGAVLEPHRLGVKDRVPLGFEFVHHKTGDVNQVTLQFYLEGTYE